ncbi:MAG TPA: nitrilase-related carbon-nitrogen hydrolase, partial [Terrimesophilobacter sp.]|nr:nitrilase-related carbon-nitrogen hydrolase [Terrimesophilobacter sp.]
MTDDSIAIAVAQFAPGDDTAQNLVDIRSLTTRAAGRGAKLVVFPEYSSFFVPEPGERSVAAAEPLDGPFATALAALAAELGIHLVAGMRETTVDP